MPRTVQTRVMHTHSCNYVLDPHATGVLRGSFFLWKPLPKWAGPSWVIMFEAILYSVEEKNKFKSDSPWETSVRQKSLSQFDMEVSDYEQSI